jgi:hypothetical protein
LTGCGEEAELWSLPEMSFLRSKICAGVKMKKINKVMRSILSFFITFVILLVGCSSSSKMTPDAAKISGISPAAGFLAAGVEKSGGFIAAADHRDKAFCSAYLYDNAIAAIALSYAGACWHAEKIADAIVFAQEHDRTFQDGRLRNAYISGDPKSDSGRSIAAGKVTIRLPGFWQDGRWQEDSYTVSTSTGNMAWAILALCTVAKDAPEAARQDYLAAAVRAADFVLGFKSESGGFTAGCEGWDDAQIEVTFKSTEHNIDLVAAFVALAKAVRENDPDKAEIYLDAAEHAKAFVFSMYDNDLHCFYTGTEADGKTISDGVIPLDTNSLAILTLGEDLEDAYQTIAFVEERMTVGGGFDFSAGDLDGIWNEGTAQMAVCYSMLGNKEKYDKVMAYLKTQAAGNGSIPAADRDGVSTGFVIAGSDTLWEYNNVQSISATGWLAFAQLNKNPLEQALK